MARAFDAAGFEMGHEGLELGHVFGQHDRGAPRADQPRGQFDVRHVGMDVVGGEAVERDADRAPLAGVQPLGAQGQLLVGPGGAELAHFLDAAAVLRQADRIAVPGPVGRVGAPAGTGHGRVDQDQARERAGVAPCRADGHARAHRMAEHDGFVHALRQRDRVVRHRVQRVVQVAGFAQPAAAHVQDVDVEFLGQPLGHEAPGDRGRGDAGNQQHLRPGAGIAQQVLAYAVGVDVPALGSHGSHGRLLQL